MVFSKRSLKINILTSILIILFSTVFIVTFYSYVQNKKVINTLSGGLFKSISSEIIKQTAKYLEPLSKLTIASSKLLSTNMNDNRNDFKFLKYSKIFLEQFPQQTMFYIGNEKKEFTALYQRNDTIWKTKNIFPENGKLVERIDFYSDKYKLINTVKNKIFSYDPTARPWYIGAKEISEDRVFWSDVYIFSTAKRPGITASYPMRNSKGDFTGAIGADIRIDKISEFLKGIKVSDYGDVYIVNDKRQIVGYHDLDKAMLKQGAKYRPALIDETLEPYLVEAYSIFEKSKKKSFEYIFNQETYLGAVLNFPEEFHNKWHVVIVAPKSDFFSSLNRVNFLSLIISVIVLFISIFISYLVSKNISKPIELLTLETNKIQDFDLEGEINIKSNILEVSQMVASVQKMKNGLISFKRYVPDLLVRRLIKTGSVAKIEGINRIISIMFTDIADFTKLTEKYSSDILVPKLCDYFDLLTKIILKNSGTIDKYIGDSVMAFWNAPEGDEDYAYNCCASALECRLALQQFNTSLEDQYGFVLSTIFTIHTGDVIVGNFGSEERLNYSAIGDSVNVANRLTKFNNIYKTQIVASEQTYKLVKEHFVFNFLDEVKVKGKEEKIRIYELIDFKHKK